MTNKFLLDRSPTGVEHSVVLEGDEFYTVEYTPSKIEKDILGSCAELRNMAQRKDAGMQLAARIPINTYMGWKKEYAQYQQSGGTLTWGQFEVAKLNSRDFCQFRTGMGSGVYGKKL